MERMIQVQDVKALRSKSGNIRYVLLDQDGNEQTTFREEIGRQAAAAKGRSARIEFHESERYLDRLWRSPTRRLKSTSRKSHGRRRSMRSPGS